MQTTLFLNTEVIGKIKMEILSPKKAKKKSYFISADFFKREKGKY